MTAGLTVQDARDLGQEAAEPPQCLTLDLVVEDERWHELIAVDIVSARAARELAAFLSVSAPASAVVCFSDDATIAALNTQFRNKPKPTNVLSFPQPALPGARPRLLGDIIIARETVAAEAARDAIAVADHVAHLVIHGLLHLMGYDHATDSEAERMEAVETAVLARLGIADPYADKEGAMRAAP
jgi:probable rRNA maturation factor